MMEFCFVLLHYKVSEMTINSMKCIFDSCNNINFNIIVVDNNSNNGSLKEIKECFSRENNIKYIKIERNVGFAKGNNIGYSVAKHTYNPDFIIIMNNDVFIKETKFCKEIEKLYITEFFDILGPNIVSKDGYNQNPIRDCIYSKKDLNRALFITRLKLLFMMFYNIKKKINNKIKETNLTNELSEKTRIGFPLHGSCLIYSKKYINKHEYAFYPDTFLYAEEDILYYLAKKEKLKLVYSPALSVIHYEDAATDAVHKTNKEKRKFQLLNSMNSLLTFKKLMDFY